MLYFNPVDTMLFQHLFVVIMHLQGRGLILCHQQSLGKRLWFAPEISEI